jgi:hypothetical protein
LTHEQGFRLNATALQRAICRAETGEPLEELASDPAVIEAMGGNPDRQEPESGVQGAPSNADL